MSGIQDHPWVFTEIEANPIKTLFIKQQQQKKDSPNILACISANASETSVVFLAQHNRKPLFHTISKASEEC